MYTKNFKSLKAELTALNQKIANLESVEAEYAEIEELLTKRTNVQYELVSLISRN